MSDFTLSYNTNTPIPTFHDFYLVSVLYFKIIKGGLLEVTFTNRQLVWPGEKRQSEDKSCSASVNVSRISYFKYARQQVVLSARDNRKYTMQIVGIFLNI